MVYSVIIGSATALPLSVLVTKGFTYLTVNIFFVAMILFLISDLILSQIYFGRDKNKAKYIVANYAFYYLAARKLYQMKVH